MQTVTELAPGQSLRFERSLLVLEGKIVLLALLARCGAFLISAGQVPDDFLLTAAGDSSGYVGMAQAWANGSWFDHSRFLQFGPGYGVFAGTIMWLSGSSLEWIIVLQIVLSAITCGLVHRLSIELGLDRLTAATAGIILALSATPIALSNLILSDTLYHFTWTAGLLILVISLRRGTWGHFLFAGATVGIGMLIRPIGQGWILGLPVVAFFHWRLSRTAGQPSARSDFRPLVARIAIAVLVAVVVAVPWFLHNLSRHDIPALAMTSAGGPASIAALTLAEMQGRQRADVMEEWFTAYQLECGREQLTRRDEYDYLLMNARRTFAAYPGAVTAQYLTVCWENLTSLALYHRVQYPAFQRTLRWTEDFLRENGLNFLPVVLTLIGLLILSLRRQWWPLAFLSVVFVYCFITTGFYPWQATRLFLPGQTATSILMAVTLIGLFQGLRRVLKRPDSR